MNFTPLQTLPDGLLLRRATPDDAEPLAEFNARWHSDEGPDHPEEPIAIWTRDLISRPHPTFAPDLATVVENPDGDIVSTCLLIPQTWTYSGISFGVGRPELIATHPDYRHRGLVRRQMEIMHAWSADLGHQMQAIEGIPWFYRQFGYEMGLDLYGSGYAHGTDIPPLKKGETERFTFRPANRRDIPFIMDVYEQESKRGRFACLRDAAIWSYEIAGRERGSIIFREIKILVKGNDVPVGFIAHPAKLWGKWMPVTFAGLKEDVSWHDVAPALLRYMFKTGDDYAQEGGAAACVGVNFLLGPAHPMFRLFPNIFTRVRPPYAWYIRIPNMAGFLNHIQPTLNDRLSASDLSGFSGKVKLNFYRDGLVMTFDSGRLISCDFWQPDPEDKGHVRFPDLTFISLLCGRKSFAELNAFYPDCFATSDTVAALLEALFPKQPSHVWGVV